MNCECGAEMMPCRVQIPAQPEWRHARICLKCVAPETVLTSQPLQAYHLPMPTVQRKFAADEAGADTETGDCWPARDVPGAVVPPQEGASQ